MALSRTKSNVNERNGIPVCRCKVCTSLASQKRESYVRKNSVRKNSAPKDKLKLKLPGPIVFPIPSLPSPSYPFQSSTFELEKWKVSEDFVKMGESLLNNLQQQEKAKNASPHSGSLICPSLERTPLGQDLPATVTNVQMKGAQLDVIEKYMRKLAKRCGYDFTIKQMADWVKERFGKGSVYLIRKIFTKYGWKRDTCKTPRIEIGGLVDWSAWNQETRRSEKSAA